MRTSSLRTGGTFSPGATEQGLKASGKQREQSSSTTTTTTTTTTASSPALEVHKKKLSKWNSFSVQKPKNRHSSELIDPYRKRYLEFDNGSMHVKVHLPLGQFHEDDLVNFWSVTSAAWVKDARVEAEHPVTGSLVIAFNFPTDAAGRERATNRIRAITEEIRILHEEERFQEQLDATAKGSQSTIIEALLMEAEQQQKLLHPQSQAVIPKQENIEYVEDMRLQMVKPGRITQLLHRGRVLPYFQLAFDAETERTTRKRVEGARCLREFLLEQAGLKSELATERSHREALMSFFAQRDKEKVTEVDSILEFYNTNEDCISRGRTKLLHGKLKIKYGTAPRELLREDISVPPDDPDELVYLAHRLQARRKGTLGDVQATAGRVQNSMTLPAMALPSTDPLDAKNAGSRSPSMSPTRTKSPTYVVIPSGFDVQFDSFKCDCSCFGELRCIKVRGPA